jgi:hypothetical protein
MKKYTQEWMMPFNMVIKAKQNKLIPKYCMGIDDYTYPNGNYESCCCVMRLDGEIMEMSHPRSKKEFEDEVIRLSKHYNIPTKNIFREK